MNFTDVQMVFFLRQNYGVSCATLCFERRSGEVDSKHQQKMLEFVFQHQWLSYTLVVVTLFSLVFGKWFSYKSKDLVIFTVLECITPLLTLKWQNFLHILLEFLNARSIQLENGFPSTECRNLLYLRDRSFKVYKMNFLDIIDKNFFDKMKFIKWN